MQNVYCTGLRVEYLTSTDATNNGKHSSLLLQGINHGCNFYGDFGLSFGQYYITVVKIQPETAVKSFLAQFLSDENNGTVNVEGILKVLSEAGAGFDIVSGGELERVLKVGADPKKIVFSGVGKQVRG